MRLSLASFAIAVTATCAFTGPVAFRPRSSSLYMSTETEETVPIVVTGNNIELTEPLQDYVKNKLNRPLSKLGNAGIMCEVHLVVNKNPKVKDAHRVEVTTSLKGATVRSTEESPDMYASIDAVADRLQRKLTKYKGRRLQGFHGGPHGGKRIDDDLTDGEEATGEDEMEEYVDPEAPKVTKIKSFDLSTPMSLDEAIFALDYIDHDFYVFRDEETNEINVVYKRNAGGVGLIQPQA